MATGSYEGSLSIEGIPDHNEASAFTRRRQRWSRRDSTSSDPSQPVKTRAGGKDEEAGNLGEARGSVRGCNEGFATGVSEARSPECRGKKTPTLVSPAREGIELEVSTQ